MEHATTSYVATYLPTLGLQCTSSCLTPAVDHVPHCPAVPPATATTTSHGSRSPRASALTPRQRSDVCALTVRRNVLMEDRDALEGADHLLARLARIYLFPELCHGRRREPGVAGEADGDVMFGWLG